MVDDFDLSLLVSEIQSLSDGHSELCVCEAVYVPPSGDQTKAYSGFVFIYLLILISCGWKCQINYTWL